MAQGRPRDERVDHKVISATRAILLRDGLAALTVDRVAAEAGVGKAAIYRRYAGKMQLVFAAAIHETDIVAPDRGSLVADLAALLDDIAESQGNRLARQVLPALLVEMSRNEDLARQLTGTYLAREQEVITEVLERAVARGELRAAPPIEVAHSLLVGPVFAWLFVLRRPFEPPERDRFAATLAAAWSG